MSGFLNKIKNIFRNLFTKLGNLKASLLFKLRDLAPLQRNRLIVASAGFILLTLIILSLMGVFNRKPQEIIPERETLVFWNVYDDEEVFKQLIYAYKEKNPYVDIVYERKRYNNYREFVSELLSAKQGPDIYAIHHTWLPLERKRLVAMNDVMPDLNPPLVINKYPEVFRFDFVVEPAPGDLEGEPKIYALPLAIDTLALYYNIDLFNTNSIVYAPRTWEEFVDVVNKLERVDENGNITLSGVALGSAFNERVNRSTDILSLLMMQSGAQMNNEYGRITFDSGVKTEDGFTYYPARDAINFYTSFANPNSQNYTWPPNAKYAKNAFYSIDAFVEGTAAMMINYSYHRETVKKRNPDLKFSVSEIPQPQDSVVKINYASYWGYAVPKISDNPKLAWDFINFITQEKNAKMYLEASDKPTALKSLIPAQQEDPELGVFANQVLTARSWRQPDFFEVQNILEEAINSVWPGNQSVSRAITEAARLINLVNLEDLY